MRRDLSRVIHNFALLPHKDKLDILIYGKGLTTKESVVVAKLVQTYIIKTQRFSF